MSIRFSVKTMCSINKIAFGSSRDEVRSAFGSEFKVFQKNEFSANTTDSYKECNIYYTQDDKFEAIEIFADNDVEVIVDGEDIPIDEEKLTTWLKSRDPMVKIDEDGAISASCSVSVYFHDGKLDSILFAAPGYYK